MYKNFLSLNEENIFENVPLVMVKMNNSTMKVVTMKFFLFFKADLSYRKTKYLNY